MTWVFGWAESGVGGVVRGIQNNWGETQVFSGEKHRSWRSALEKVTGGVS